MKIFILIFTLFTNINLCIGYSKKHEKLKEVFSWKQIEYDFNGVLYTDSTNYERKKDAIYFQDEIEDREKFFIQPNNVPIGFEVYRDKVFVTVPRRRYGIPSTLNYFNRVHKGHHTPALKPYPDVWRSKQLISVYRPRVDACDRLWAVDTGHLEVPRKKQQLKLRLRKIKSIFSFFLCAWASLCTVQPIFIPLASDFYDSCSTFKSFLPARTLIKKAISLPPSEEQKDAFLIKRLKSIFVPDDRRQIKPPAIIIFDLKTDRQILRHDLNPSIMINNRTSAGLTSITVDVDPSNCHDAFAYINDLATDGLVVYSLRDNRSWRVDHPSFRHDEAAMNFTASGHIINWRDGIFSIALAERDGEKLAFYHPLVSTKEFAISTTMLKSQAPLDGLDLTVGDAGPNTQRASHDFHKGSNTMFFANVAQSAVLCWNIGTVYLENDIQIVAQDSNRLGYISDLKVIGDEVWVLSNQIPKFIYGTQNINEYNYFIMRGSVHELIAGTKCVVL